MAKAIIEFDLSDEQDALDFKMFNKANDMHSVLFEIFYNTKKGLAYSMEGKEMDKYEVLEMVYEKLYQILNTHNVNLDELN